MATDFKPRVAIAKFEHLPDDVQANFAFWARQGLSPSEIQNRLGKLKLAATKNRISEWSKAIPGVEANSVEDLPFDIKAKVIEAYVDRKPNTEIKQICANNGYKVSDVTINRWFNDLLRDRQKQELSGELDDNGLSLNEELLTRIITWVSDAIMKILVNVDLGVIEVKDANSLEKVVTLGLKTAQIQMGYQKLKTDECVMLNKARKEMKNEVQRRLVGKPEVVAALFEAIDSSANNLINNAETTG